MNTRFNIAAAALMLPLAAFPQHIRKGYVDPGTSNVDFPKALQSWSKGKAWSADDNFYISRVRPHIRFRNAATQVNPLLTEETDKNLLFWVPINTSAFNALPDGRFDSEVFPSWEYITHWGNWTAQMVRMPGGFADVAHRNGVPVSVVASVPLGRLSTQWSDALTTLGTTDPALLADYLEYYGVDGIGYNSEFRSSPDLVGNLSKLHGDVRKLLRESGRMPLCEFVWYDGTDENGTINYDMSLDTHNDDIFGSAGNERASLFFNYNWNFDDLLGIAMNTLERIGRSPKDIYCGINMQGGEPANENPEIWTLLQRYPFSIGLWGAHESNMLFESRAEKGTLPETSQRSYLTRVEKWFTGGSRNPINTPAVSDIITYGVDNTTFMGMSKLMSARSALKWDLSEEPFITHFNLGNGRFFNYKGERCHNSEWYNIGIQDYMPTWKWWFATKFLGRDAADAPTQGLDAAFVWDDAWRGGSCLRINGSSANEYLHLFKTEYALKDGDVITLRYKALGGSGDISLALSAKGDESTPIAEEKLKSTISAANAGEWIERKFTIGKDFAWPAGKELAMVALHFSNASGLDLRLGEFSIIRGEATSEKPATPQIERAEILSARHDGVDAKVIFNMPNDKGNDICYNIDVKTSQFKLYACQEGEAPVLMGMTTSWAGLLYSIPVDVKGSRKMKIGVSALSLDMTSESEIAWSDWMDTSDKYEYDDRIAIEPRVLNPGDPFTISYVDPLHLPGNWELKDGMHNQYAFEKDVTGISLTEGLEKPGNYDLTLQGYENSDKGIDWKERTFNSYVQVIPAEAGKAPRIKSFTANGEDTDIIRIAEGTDRVTINYEAETGEASLSRGVRIGEGGFGTRCSDAGIDGTESFSVSFWFKADNFDNKSVHLLNIRDKFDEWPRNQWGWFWHTLDADGKTAEFAIRMKNGDDVYYNFDKTRFYPGEWYHLTYSFNIVDQNSVRVDFFVNGGKQRVTSWRRGNSMKTIAPTPQGDFYPWREDNVLAVGGFLHNHGSAVGNIDNFMIWNKALTVDDKAAAIGDVKPGEEPEWLSAYYDFESEPAADGKFISPLEGAIPAGIHTYAAEGKEGQGALCWTKPEFCAGSPFISGNTYTLKPKVEFATTGAARLINKDGDAATGIATFSIPSSGFSTISVSVSNEYGTDTRKVRIYGPELSESAPELEMPGISVGPNPFTDYIRVMAPAAGRYRISLYTIDGRCILSNDFTCAESETMIVWPETEAGLYLLTIEKDGQKLESAKLLRE